jgi:chromate reductase
LRILAISGSLRSGSHNTGLLRALQEEAPEGIEIELWNGIAQIPAYDADLDLVRGPDTVEALRSAVREADAVFFSTPEYNSSVPGALKNALDWASRPLATNVFRNKPVGVVSASAGAFGAVWAAAELRKVLGAMGARVADIELAVGHAGEKFDEDGNLIDVDVRDTLREALETLVSEVTPAAVSLDLAR